MKRFLFISILLIALNVVAEPMEVVKFYATAITNSAAVTANSDVKTRGVRGWADALVLDLGGYASPTVTVSLTSTGPLGARTLFSKASITADDTYPIRDTVVTSTGTGFTLGATTSTSWTTNVVTGTGAVSSATMEFPARYPLLDDIFTFSIFAANVTTAITGSAYLIISPTP